MYYLDNCATTPTDPAVVEAVARVLAESYGNPSSVHQAGRQAAKVLAGARSVLAESIAARPSELVLTASGTEANNLVIGGCIEAALFQQGAEDSPIHVVSSSTEHASVAGRLAWEVRRGRGRVEWTQLPVDPEGRISMDQLDALLRERPETCLVTLLHGNNETGVLLDLDRLFDVRLRHPRVPFHLDIVQSYTKLPIDVRVMPVDFLTAASHKIHGPKGAAFAFVRQGRNLEPLLIGGAQEKYRRAGTEDVAAVAGFAEAARLASDPGRNHRLLVRLEQVLLAILQEEGAAFSINGPASTDLRLPGILNLAFPGVQNKEDLLIALDLDGVCVSSTSACHSGVVADSRVLQAMGLPEERRAGSIRIGLSRLLAEADVAEAARRIARAARRIAAAA